jgi:hypothetical protein
MMQFKAIHETNINRDRAGILDPSNGRRVADIYGDSMQERNERVTMFAHAPEMVAVLRHLQARLPQACEWTERTRDELLAMVNDALPRSSAQRTTKSKTC